LKSDKRVVSSLNSLKGNFNFLVILIIILTTIHNISVSPWYGTTATWVQIQIKKFHFAKKQLFPRAYNKKAIYDVCEMSKLSFHVIDEDDKDFKFSSF
jgi:hypothetical protein